MASRGRPSVGASVSNKTRTRSAQSAAHVATRRRSASLSDCGESVPVILAPHPNGAFLEQCQRSPIVSPTWNTSSPRATILRTKNRRRQISTKRCRWWPSQPGRSCVTGYLWNMLVPQGSGFGLQDLGQHYAASVSMTCWKRVCASVGASQRDTAVTRKHSSRSSRHAELEERNRNATVECLKRFKLRVG